VCKFIMDFLLQNPKSTYILYEISRREKKMKEDKWRTVSVLLSWVSSAVHRNQEIA